MSTTPTTEAPVETVPFTMDLSKQEMLGHLREYHNIEAYSLPSGKNTTKADLVEIHGQQHERLDWLTSLPNFTYNEERGFSRHLTPEEVEQWRSRFGTHSRYPRVPQIMHTHTVVPVAENVAKAATALTTKRDNTPIAALNASERKALKDVVDNDFSMLRQEIRAMSADIKAQRRREVEQEWADRKAATKAYERKVHKAVASFNKKMADMRGEARDAGIELATPRLETYGIKAEVKGFAEAMREADAEVQRDEDRALMTLERQRLEAQRQVLLTGVSGEVAQTVLGAIPSAQTLMVEAAKAKAATQQINA